MLNKTEIAVLTLGRLGVSHSITDLDTDTSNQAKILRRHFRMALDTLLERHPWRCATLTLALTLQSEDPDRALRYHYDLPADCAVLREIAEDGIFYQVEVYDNQRVYWEEVYTGTATQRIATNCYQAHGKYTVRIDEDAYFPTHMARGLSAQLAKDVAPALITGNYSKLKKDLIDDADRDISLAIADDMGRQPPKGDAPSPFHSARYASY